MADGSVNYKVRLISVASIENGVSTDEADMVIFEVTPAFSETRSVNYTQIQPVHIPGGIQVYKNTNARTFTVGAHFISRTVEEATQNMIYLQTLRGWQMPYFGSRSTTISTRSGDADGIELLGAPPDVLYLYAYSTDRNNSRKTPYSVNINRIPVVLSDLNITYPEDVDYLPTFSDESMTVVDENSEPFPVKMDVTITLLETHSPREYESFSLAKYKNGTLVNF